MCARALDWGRASPEPGLALCEANARGDWVWWPRRMGSFGGEGAG